MDFMSKVGETIDKVGEKVDSIMKPKYDYRKESKKRLEKEIEEEKLDDSPRYKCDNPSMSVNGYVEILKDIGYKKGIKKWNVWFPEGYNNIDTKLEKVKLLNDEQIIFTLPGCDIAIRYIIPNT